MKKHLQRRRMPALVAALGMARTGCRGHQHNGIELKSTIFADVFALLTTFIKFVLALMTAVRVFTTSSRN